MALRGAPIRRRCAASVSAAGDYAVGIGLGWRRHRALPLPPGPIITWRTLSRPETPGLDEIGFSLGDLELF